MKYTFVYLLALLISAAWAIVVMGVAIGAGVEMLVRGQLVAAVVSFGIVLLGMWASAIIFRKIVEYFQNKEAQNAEFSNGD